MALDKIFIILGALLSILGTYVFAIYGIAGTVGSGIGFFLNTIGGGLADPTLFAGASAYASGLGIEVWVYYIFVIIFLIFLAAGILQLIGLKSRIAGLIFSLFPLGVGIMLILVFYTDALGLKSLFFTIFFAGEQYGNFFPILVNLGDIDLGVYLILGGGALGVISTFLERD
ncbi:hypothetical protein ES705_08550 [subsurface metagenome]|uniref:Uncharacterized protein n=1 Tax=marine sediment metagenome TaxID=412755 RepID=X1JD45_9ZZZZ